MRAVCRLQIQYLKLPGNKISIFLILSKSLTFIPYCQNSQANRISSDIFKEAKDNIIGKHFEKHAFDMVESESLKRIHVW
jgi:hypothetical protein